MWHYAERPRKGPLIFIPHEHSSILSLNRAV